MQHQYQNHDIDKSYEPPCSAGLLKWCISERLTNHRILIVCYNNVNARLLVHQLTKMDPTFPLIPTLNLLSCILVLLSYSRSMFRSWNVGVCTLAIWNIIACLINVVDTIVWADNVDNKAPIWCDIGIAFQLHHYYELLSADFIRSYSPCCQLGCHLPCCILHNNPKAFPHDTGY